VRPSEEVLVVSAPDSVGATAVQQDGDRCDDSQPMADHQLVELPACITQLDERRPVVTLPAAILAASGPLNAGASPRLSPTPS
jgi:hypothetical protein